MRMFPTISSRINDLAVDRVQPHYRLFRTALRVLDGSRGFPTHMCLLLAMDQGFFVLLSCSIKKSV